MATILLTGANGKTSTATIAALQGSGHKLIGLVRDAARGKDLGIELRVGDLERPRTLERVFDGVDTLYLVSPPGPLAPYHSSNALWAARQAGVKHVVRLSAVGAAHGAPTVNSRLHALSDTEVAASGIPFTILKPHFFLQNLAFSAETIAQEGAMYWAFGEAKFPGIDVDDIGEVAARILTNPRPHTGRTYTLTGGEAVSVHQIAAAIGEAIGKPVKYVPVPVAAMVEGAAKMGLDDYLQVAYRDYMTAYSQGWQSLVTDSVKRITGREPRTIAEFARRNAAAFRADGGFLAANGA